MENKKTEYQQYIISKIRNLRSERQKSQVELAQILKISSGQLGNIESSKFPHKYTLKQIDSICRYFSVSIQSIFFEEDEIVSIESLVQKIIQYEQ